MLRLVYSKLRDCRIIRTTCTFLLLKTAKTSIITARCLDLQSSKTWMTLRTKILINLKCRTLNYNFLSQCCKGVTRRLNRLQYLKEGIRNFKIMIKKEVIQEAHSKQLTRWLILMNHPQHQSSKICEILNSCLKSKISMPMNKIQKIRNGFKQEERVEVLGLMLLLLRHNICPQKRRRNKKSTKFRQAIPI